MRCKIMLLALTLVVACGAGPFRGGFAARNVVSGPTTVAPAQTAITAPIAVQQTELAQIMFKGADGMTVQWDTTTIGAFDSAPLVCPGLQNFGTARTYRLKISNIPNREGTILYPTLTVNAVTPRTRAYLDHNAIPVKFTDSDFDQIASGNFVTKVIFLPSPKFQNLALAGGVDTIVNTQLPAGTDPIVEAQNRGAILAVVRIGNKDLSLGGTLDSVSFAGNPGQQIPIAGVNAPEFGVPASADVPNPTQLPTVDAPNVKAPLIEQASPNPSANVPAVDANWGGSNF